MAGHRAEDWTSKKGITMDEHSRATIKKEVYYYHAPSDINAWGAAP